MTYDPGAMIQKHRYQHGRTGHRQKISNAFLNNFHRQWRRDGPKALEHMAKKDPSRFCELAAKLLPRDVNVTHQVGASFLQLLERIDQGLAEKALGSSGENPIVDSYGEPVARVTQHLQIDDAAPLLDALADDDKA